MSSSLLGTFQTDWITGRSLETVFFSTSVPIIGGSFQVLTETLCEASKNEREWKRRQDNYYVTVCVCVTLLTVKVIFYSLAHLNLYCASLFSTQTPSKISWTRKRMQEEQRASNCSTTFFSTWEKKERNSLDITNGICILLQHFYDSIPSWFGPREMLVWSEKFNRYTKRNHRGNRESLESGNQSLDLQFFASKPRVFVSFVARRVITSSSNVIMMLVKLG